MHRGRNTLILLVLGLIVGGYVYFIEMKKPPPPEPGSEGRAKLFTVEASKIDALTVKASTGERTTLKKTGDVWQIVEPTQAAVDPSEVSGLTTSLAALESQRVVEEKAADLAKFGLAEPRVEVTFRAAGDKADRHLMIGAKTPTGGDLYAKLAGDPKVMLVPGYLESSFDRTTFQLRDKTMLLFDRDKVDTIEITNGGAGAAPSSMTFTKQGDAWTLTKPAPARTDSAAVEGILGRLASAQMKSMASTDPGDLATYGLAKPDVQVTLRAGSTASGLILGSESQDGGTYAKDTSRPMVFTIEKPLADDLRKPSSDFRQKDLLEFRAFTGHRMEIALTGGVAQTFEKKKGTEKDAVEKWTRTQPASTGTIDATKIDDLATRLADLRAEAFVDALPKGATSFGTIATQFGDEKKSESVTLYRAGTDYYATRPNDAGALKLKVADVETFTKALDAVK